MKYHKSIDQELAAEGWIKRFVTSEPRLSEAVLAYQEAGFETRIESLPRTGGKYSGDDANDVECRNCLNGHEDEYRIIYTRPKRRDN